MKKLLKLLIESENPICLNAHFTCELIKLIGDKVYLETTSDSSGNYHTIITGLKEKAKPMIAIPDEITVELAPPVEEIAIPFLDFVYPDFDTLTSLKDGRIQTAIAFYAAILSTDVDTATRYLFDWVKSTFNYEIVNLFVDGKKLDAVKKLTERNLTVYFAKHLADVFIPFIEYRKDDFYDNMTAKEFVEVFSKYI